MEKCLNFLILSLAWVLMGASIATSSEQQTVNESTIRCFREGVEDALGVEHFSSSPFGMAHELRNAPRDFSAWAAKTGNQVIQLIRTDTSPKIIFENVKRSRLSFAETNEGFVGSELANFGLRRDEISGGKLRNEDYLGISTITLEGSKTHGLPPGYDLGNADWNRLAALPERKAWANRAIQSFRENHADLQTIDGRTYLLNREYKTLDGHSIPVMSLKAERIFPSDPNSPLKLSALNAPTTSIEGVLNDIYKRLEIVQDPKTPASQAQEQLLAAMNGYFWTMPYRRGSAANGRVILSAYLSYLKGHPVKVDPEIDIQAFVDGIEPALQLHLATEQDDHLFLDDRLYHAVIALYLDRQGRVGQASLNRLFDFYGFHFNQAKWNESFHAVNAEKTSDLPRVLDHYLKENPDHTAPRDRILQFLEKHVSEDLVVPLRQRFSQGVPISRVINEFPETSNFLVPKNDFLKDRDAYDRTVARAPHSWSGFDQEFREVTKKNIQFNIALYLEAKAKGDPRILFMERVGYRFEPEVIVPPVGDVIKGYEDAMQKHVASGRISQSDVIHPARIFKDSSGKYHFVRYGEEAPQDAWPYLGRLNTNEFLPLLGQGLFPIGDNLNYLEGAIPQSTSEHDLLEHFMGFAENPDYAAQLKATYKQLAQQKVNLSTQVTPSGQREYSRLSDRMYMALELMATVRSENKSKLDDFLNIPETRPSEILTVKQVEEHLKKLSHEEITELRKKLVAHYLEVASNPSGGAYGLLSNSRSRFENRYRSFGMTLPDLWQILSYPENHQLTGEKLVHELARFEVYLKESTRVSPVQWVKDASVADEQFSETSLYKLFCLTGLFTPGDYYYRAHCEVGGAR